MVKFSVIAIPSVRDCYIYYIYPDDDIQIGVFLDSGDKSARILKFREDFGLEGDVPLIMNT